MRCASLKDLEAENIHLADKLSASVTFRDIRDHLKCGGEVWHRDGLGAFDVIVFCSDVIGYWALAASKAYPEQGVSVWADPRADSPELADVVSQSLAPMKTKLICAQSGEVLR